jgi:ABC-type multidrug transport system fused ATPase/permease subunit
LQPECWAILLFLFTYNGDEGELADRMILISDGKIVEELHAKEIQSLDISESKKRGIRLLRIKDLSYTNNSINPYSSILKLSDLNYNYKDKVHGITIPHIQVKIGAVVAVIGHNGAEKSTFAKYLYGYAITSG